MKNITINIIFNSFLWNIDLLGFWVLLCLLGILRVVSKQLDLFHGKFHHLGKFREPYVEIADQGCYCFLRRCHGLSFWAFLSYSNLNFSVLTSLMSLRYLSIELHKRVPNTVISFFVWSGCAGFIFVWYSILVYNALCSMSMMVSGFYFVPHCTIYFWHHVLCYLPNICNYNL